MSVKITEVNEDGSSDEELLCDTGPRITKKELEVNCSVKLLHSEPRKNHTLFLHFRGYKKIENIEEYTEIETLWLECNKIEKIENLEQQKKLRFLYLHCNKISQIENISHLQYLDTLALSRNFIRKLEYIDQLPNLRSLYIAHNKLQTKEDIEVLQGCYQLIILDIANNKLKKEDVVTVFGNMASLKVLKFTGNPVIKKLGNRYRTSMIYACKNLLHLDKIKIIPEDREAVDNGEILEDEKLDNSLEFTGFLDCMDQLPHKFNLDFYP